MSKTRGIWIAAAMFAFGTSAIPVMAQNPIGPAGGQAPMRQSSPSQVPGSQSPSGMNGMGNQSDSTHMDSGAKTMMTSPDAKFAAKAAQGGLTEVKTGQLAADKASNPDVKAFGQQMVDDHGKANEQLKAVAQEKGMTLPTDVSAKQQAMYDKLSKLSGAEFDHAYVKAMLMDHQDDVKEFTKESTKGKDEKIKGFATQTLPIIQGHLDKLKGIQSKMGSGSSMN